MNCWGVEWTERGMDRKKMVDGWKNGTRGDRGMGGWVEERKDGGISRGKNCWRDGRTDGRTYGMDRQVDAHTDGRTDGRMDGRMDR